jgi:Helitron helicase-like domain at N-terminus
MLIQLASPFIPLRHIKNGVFGLNGHVCCFEQDVAGFMRKLPRDKTDVTMLQVLKVIRTEIGADATRTEAYKVRKKQVLHALIWLKQYNREYEHIEIDMGALNWVDGDEGTMDTIDIPVHDDLHTDESAMDDVNADLGPAPSLTRESLRIGNNIKDFGYIDESPSDILSPTDTSIHNEILSEITQSKDKKKITVQWPATGPVAISEYGVTRLFTRAFPWLFPGGIGDVKDDPNDINRWGKRLLFYEDGRFARDKFFSFFALNYITRHRNSKSGNWFIKEFNQGGPESLEELKESIRNGDTSFVNRIMYYNQRVKGSTSYWFQKRSQVYSWIYHHIQAGHGPPTFFITLSCGEYYWPDIIRLINNRMVIAGDDRAKECYAGSKRLSEIINDYSIVIQEFFQERVELWLDTVGRNIFGIIYHWGRYEFAPGRGQIHIHLLAIRREYNIYNLHHQARHAET